MNLYPSLKASLLRAGLVSTDADEQAVVDAIAELVEPVTAANETTAEIEALRAHNDTLRQELAEKGKQIAAANAALAKELRDGQATRQRCEATRATSHTSPFSCAR